MGGEGAEASGWWGPYPLVGHHRRGGLMATVPAVARTGRRSGERGRLGWPAGVGQMARAAWPSGPRPSGEGGLLFILKLK